MTWLAYVPVIAFIFFAVMIAYSISEPIPIHKTFHFDDTTVRCERWNDYYCGLTLRNCDNNMSYRCLTNVRMSE